MLTKLQRIRGHITLSHEERAIFKATAFIFGISSVNLYAFYNIFRKYITYQRYSNEVAAIQQMNDSYNKIQNHRYLQSSASLSKSEEQVLFPAFLRTKYSENSHHAKQSASDASVVLGVQSPSNYKRSLYTTHKRHFGKKSLVIDHSVLTQTNALYLNSNYKNKLRSNSNSKPQQKHKYNKPKPKDKMGRDPFQIWEERKTIDYNHNVMQNDFRNMRLRQITQCFDEINIENDSYPKNNNDALNYFDFDYSFQENEDISTEEYVKKSQQLKEYNYHNNYSYLNNNYDDDHLNLFAIHHFIERILHKDQHGNVVLRVSREHERPSILAFNEEESKQLSFNNKYDASLLRYYVDIYYVRFNIIASMMLDFKYFASEFKKVLRSYFHEMDRENGANKHILAPLETEVYKRHSQLTLLKHDIYKQLIQYCDSIRIPDELLMNTEDALAVKEELLTEILPLYFLSGISDIPLQTASNRVQYNEHLRVLFDYFSHKMDTNEDYDAYHQQTLDDYINIISRLVKIEDYDDFQHGLQHDENNFNSYPKLALHLLSILECKYSNNLFPRTCYRIIRTLCKKIELFGAYNLCNNELLRVSLKKLCIHSPEFFNNLSFYQLLSMCYVNIEGHAKYNHFMMDSVCNKLLEMKYKMLGGSIHSADLSFLCNNEYLMYWLRRIIEEYNNKHSNSSIQKTSSMDLLNIKSMHMEGIQSLPISVFGYDGLLFILLKYFDVLTYLNRNEKLSEKIIEIIDDILALYQHNQNYHSYHRCNAMEHWTVCCALNFIIKKCAEFGNTSNGFIFGGDDMLLIMDKISQISCAVLKEPMIYDINAIKKALSLAPNHPETMDAFRNFITSWSNILNKQDVKMTSNTWLMLSLSSSVSITEKYHYPLFHHQLRRTMKYANGINYRCLYNMQADLSPIIFFNKHKANQPHQLLRKSAYGEFNAADVAAADINVNEIMIEGMLMNLNHGKDLYRYFMDEWRSNNNSVHDMYSNDAIYKLFKHKIDRNDLFNIIPLFNNLTEILPMDKFGMFEIGKLLTLFRKTKNVDLSLSLFDSLSFKKKYGNFNNELMSLLICTLIENGRLEAAKYWIQRYLSCYPVLCGQLIDNFFNDYLTYNMTANRSRRCQGRDRQILKSFYDNLVINHYKDTSHTKVNPVFDQLLIYSLEFAPENVQYVIFDKDIGLNTYKSKSECIEEVLIHLMTNNKADEVSLLLRTLYLNNRELLEENIEIIVRSFLPIIRFLANNDEYKLIHQLFNRFDEYNNSEKKTFSIPITTQKIELLLDDKSGNLPVIKDFYCLKKSENHRTENKNVQKESDADDYNDPVVDMINLWKDFYFNNRHTNKAMITKLYDYFVRKDTFLFENNHFSVSKDINVRVAHYLMMDVICNENIFNDSETNIPQNRKNNHFKQVLIDLFKEYYPDAYKHSEQFTKEQQNKDLRAVLRQL